MSATLTLAREERGCIVHIDDVNKAAGKIYYCAGCGEKVTAVKTLQRKKDWHFRHEPSWDISSCIDKALHDYAVQVIMDSSSIVIAKNRRVDYTTPRKEVSLLGRRSDVTVNDGSHDIHFEIVVTHDCEPEKIETYRSSKIKSVGIDLSDSKFRSADRKTIEQLVLNEFSNKRIIYWEDAIKPAPSPSTGFSWEKLLLFIVTVTGLWYLTKKLFFNSRGKR